jgi:hypothetical protein
MADAYGGSFVYNGIGGLWVRPPCIEPVLRAWITWIRRVAARQVRVSRAEVNAWKAQSSSLISRLR